MEKILHIENSKRVTGSFRALVAFVKGTKDEFISYAAFPKGSTHIEILEREGVTCVTFNFLEIRKNIWRVIIYLPMLFINSYKVWKYCKKNGIRIIHSNDHFNLVPIVIKIFVRKRVCLIAHVRLLPSTYNGALYGVFRWLTKKFADYIIVVSNAVADVYGRKDNLFIINGAYKIDEKHPAYAFNRHYPFRFLCMGNYIKGKGQRYALAAFFRLKEKYKLDDVALHFYGGLMGLKKNTEFKVYLFNKVKEQKLEHCVFFHDFSSDIEKTYKDHDVSLMFSLSESFSMICFESLSFGIPTIASDCGGPVDIIDNLENGIIVPNKDVEAMADAMYKLYSDTDLCKQFSFAGKKKVDAMIQKSDGLSLKAANISFRF